MNQSRHTDEPIELEAMVNAYRREVAEAVKMLIPDVIASVEVDHRVDRAEPAIIVSVPFAGFRLRVEISERFLGRQRTKSLSTLLAERIQEARRHHVRFVGRLDDTRAKVMASLARNGGMRLASLEMDAQPIDQRFHWYQQLLELKVETLNAKLEPVVECLRGYTARKFAGTLRLMGADHRRAVGIRDRLMAAGAVGEITHDAEAAIVESGRDVGTVVRHLFADGRAILLRGEISGGFDSRVFVTIHQRRIQTMARLLERLPARYIQAEELIAA